MFLSIFIILLLYVSFPDRSDAILSKNERNIAVSASGSIGIYYSGKCHITSPNSTLNDEKKNDWCSNIVPLQDGHPWISYTIRGKSMRVKGYSVRSGCCYYACCCIDANTDIDYCCCELYSFSLEGSNNNITWSVIHHVEKDNDFWNCKTNTYEFPLTQPFKYIRFHMNDKRSYCPNCMALNQIELYGDTISSYDDFSTYENDLNDESVSIIGKIHKGQDQ